MDGTIVTIDYFATVCTANFATGISGTAAKA